MKEKYVYECKNCKYIFDPEKEAPIMFKELSECPQCGADIKLMQKKEKENPKADLEKKLKKLKEKEKEKLRKEEALRKEEIRIGEAVIDYIYDETMNVLNELVYELTKEKSISVKQFSDTFYKRAFNILVARKREYYPSNHFISSFRDYILDFNESVVDAFEDKQIYASLFTETEDKRIILIEEKSENRVNKIIDKNEDREENITKKIFAKSLANEVKRL